MVTDKHQSIKTCLPHVILPTMHCVWIALGFCIGLPGLYRDCCHTCGTLLNPVRTNSKLCCHHVSALTKFKAGFIPVTCIHYKQLSALYGMKIVWLYEFYNLTNFCVTSTDISGNVSWNFICQTLKDLCLLDVCVWTNWQAVLWCVLLWLPHCKQRLKFGNTDLLCCTTCHYLEDHIIVFIF
jgi:hypothetical protein